MTASAYRDTLTDGLDVLAGLFETAGVPASAARFVTWRREPRRNPRTDETKITKVPYQPDEKHASVADPRTWSPLLTCRTALEGGRFAGVGVVLTGDRLACVDLDKCIVDGELTDEAVTIVSRLDTYAEISQSGTGLHLWLTVPDGTSYGHSRYPVGGGKEAEVYTTGRFIAITGDQLPGTPAVIADRSDVLRELTDQWRPTPDRRERPAGANVGPTMGTSEDEWLLHRLHRQPDFTRRYDGDWESFNGHYKSESHARFRLVCEVAKRTHDRDQIERLLRDSGMFTASEKWQDREGLLPDEVQKAITETELDPFWDQPRRAPARPVVMTRSELTSCPEPAESVTEASDVTVPVASAQSGPELAQIISLDQYRRVCAERDDEHAQRLAAEERVRQLEADRDRERFRRREAEERHRHRDRLERDRQAVLRNRSLPGADVMIATVAELAQKDANAGRDGLWHPFPQSFATQTTGKSRSVVSKAHRLLAAIGATDRDLRPMPGDDYETTHLKLRMSEVEALARLAAYVPAADETGAVPNTHGGKRTATIVPITLPICPECGPAAAAELTVACVGCGSVLDRQIIEHPPIEAEPARTDQPTPMRHLETLLVDQHRRGAPVVENAMFQDDACPPTVLDNASQPPTPSYDELPPTPPDEDVLPRRSYRRAADLLTERRVS